MIAPVVIRCAGRSVTADGQATGDPCGRTFATPQHRPDGYDANGMLILRATTAAEVRQCARGAGWRVHVNPDGDVIAACDRCSRPDPATVAVCRDIEKGLRR